MKLQQAVNQYVSHKRSLGMQCQTMARQLRAFCKASGDIKVDEVGAETAHAFIYGSGPDKPEMDAILAAAKQRQLTAQGRRDYAMLVFLYNTGARADERRGSRSPISISRRQIGTDKPTCRSEVRVAARANVHSGLRQCARSRTRLANGCRTNPLAVPAWVVLPNGS